MKIDLFRIVWFLFFVLFACSCTEEIRTKNKAMNGDPEAQVKLGYLHYVGREAPFHRVSKDRLEAFRWFEKAADQGYAKGQCASAILYLHGQGVEKSQEMAYRKFFLAADQGEPFAEHAIGYLHIVGNKCSKASPWYQKSASGGDEYAKIILEALDSGQDCEDAEFRKEAFSRLLNSQSEFLFFLGHDESVEIPR